MLRIRRRSSILLYLWDLRGVSYGILLVVEERDISQFISGRLDLKGILIN